MDYNKVMNTLPIQTFPGEVMIPLTYFDDVTNLEMVVRDGFAIVRSKEAASVYHANPRRAEMLLQVAAFEQQHKWLVENHLGEYVAFMGGEIIDHDTDHHDLRKRIDSKYLDATVLVRRVEVDLPASLRGSFPRFAD